MENASAEEKLLPPWMDALIRSSFFEICSSHAQWYGKKIRGESPNPRCVVRSGGRNFLCLDCCAAVCSRCTQEEHRGHRAVQIRVSSFQNVVRVTDIKPFFDVAQVQTHVSNGCRVVCINKRPKTRGRWPGNGVDAGGSACKVCFRVLRGVYTFCSIECKVRGHATALALQAQTAAEATIISSNARERDMSSSARKRARKATPQRAHLGCTL